MHYWGDGFEYFDDVSKAACDIGRYCRKRGRISVRDMKEKYGTARVYCSLGWFTFSDILWPGHICHRYPFGTSRWGWKLNYTKFGKLLGKLFWKTDIWFSKIFLHNSLAANIVERYHIRVYQKAYEVALKKYPHIAREILYGADYPELLKHLKIHATVRELLMEEDDGYSGP
jgi:hypothetical protein